MAVIPAQRSRKSDILLVFDVKAMASRSQQSYCPTDIIGAIDNVQRHQNSMSTFVGFPSPSPL